MNLIDYLIADHDNLRKHFTEIKKSLGQGPALEEKLKRFIADFETHETIEQRMLVAQLKRLPESGKLADILAGWESEHKGIHAHLDQLTAAIQSSHFQDIQQSFFNFCAFIEAHISVEERSFFATIQKLLDRKLLEELGRKAEELAAQRREQFLKQ